MYIRIVHQALHLLAVGFIPRRSLTLPGMGSRIEALKRRSGVK